VPPCAVHHYSPPCDSIPQFELNLSSNYFGDLIKKESGISALDYIQTIVIDRAKDKIFESKNQSLMLLMSWDLSILNILQGFSNKRLVLHPLSINKQRTTRYLSFKLLLSA
jgi:hypothetical protein